MNRVNLCFFQTSYLNQNSCHDKYSFFSKFGKDNLPHPIKPTINFRIFDRFFNPMKQDVNHSNILTISILLIGVVLFALNLLLGSVSIPFQDFCQAAFHGEDNTYRSIIMEYRMPQAITALLAGIGLSVSGLLMQTLFRNPLADPSILGISSGASLGVALVVLLAGSFSGIALSQSALW